MYFDFQKLIFENNFRSMIYVASLEWSKNIFEILKTFGGAEEILEDTRTTPSPCTSKKSLVPPKFTCLPLFNIMWEWVKVGTDAVNFIYCVNVPAPPKCYYTFLVLCLFSIIHSFVLLQSFSAVVPLIRASSVLHSLQWSLCLRSFILSVVVPRRGLYCMTLIYVFLSNSDLFILFEYAFDYCFVYSVTLSMHYCDYYCDWRLISSSE